MRLAGQHVLLAEDEALIALDLEQIIVAEGGEAAGHAPTLSKAMALADTKCISLAILDFRLGAQNTLPLAEKLDGLGIPFIFYTACALDELSEAWPLAPIVRKPASAPKIIRELDAVLIKKCIPLILPGCSCLKKATSWMPR